MDKKYQVFVSSTYQDLKEERLAVIQYLLKMGFIPVGMEQFPASNMSQMEYIKMMLDDCDYYLLILAGKYGTLDKDGVGFTEKEYNYAIEKGIPVISFLINDLGKIENCKCENTDDRRALLHDFRQKVANSKMVDFYTDIGSLTSAVAAALYRCVQDYPAKGWTRGESLDIPSAIEDFFSKNTIILDAGGACE